MNLFDFNLFVWFVTVSGLIASWITIFKFVRDSFSEKESKNLAKFLSDTEDITHFTWTEHFIRIFDAIFRPSGKFLISVPRSFSATSIGLIVSAGIVTTIGGSSIWLSNARGLENPYLTISAILIANYIADYISLGQTRYFLFFFRKCQNIFCFLILVFIDYIFTIILPFAILIVIALVFHVFVLMETPPLNLLLIEWGVLAPFHLPAQCIFQIQVSEEFRLPPYACNNPVFVVPLMTTFITTVWFITFAISTWVARGPLRWLQGASATPIRNPFALLVAIFAAITLTLLSVIPLIVLT